ncbi:hypothetical protein [Asticcacaulis sp. YBE204]|uniref:hypothetical protein n=1 Tax=Asticcacaulis sp. YBE204 TaxID=1282363 RepID=UPI0003C3CE0E|nr:hypothetical protein [Asticcacaulis sp. YBE204]ESQ79543.1 hypothetical protein AEYBE204_06780 [Asticcacaulis sp. YBE204]
MSEIFTGGVIMTIILQSAAALMWFGRAGARLDTLEARFQQQAGVVERLARLEEQALATRAALARIEIKLDEARI